MGSLVKRKSLKYYILYVNIKKILAKYEEKKKKKVFRWRDLNPDTPDGSRTC